MKKILVSILVAIMFLSAFSFVNAGSASVDLTPSVTTVKRGDSFTVSIVANGEYNVTGLEAVLSYDNTKLSLEEKQTNNGFGNMGSGNKLAALIGAESLSEITLSKTVQIYTLKFKVLDNAAYGNTEILLSDVGLALVNDKKEQIDVTAVGDSVTIEIKEEQQEVPDTTAPVGTIEYRTNEDKTVTATITFNESNVTITNNDGKSSYIFTKNGEFTFEFQDAAGNKGTATAKVTSIVEPPKDDNTTPGEGDLPQTGSEIITVMAVVALGAVSIISFSAYKRYKNI